MLAKLTGTDDVYNISVAAAAGTAAQPQGGGGSRVPRPAKRARTNFPPNFPLAAVGGSFGSGVQSAHSGGVGGAAFSGGGSMGWGGPLPATSADSGPSGGDPNAKSFVQVRYCSAVIHSITNVCRV